MGCCNGLAERAKGTDTNREIDFAEGTRVKTAL